MKLLNSASPLQKLVSFVGAATATALMGLPALAQLNPSPSIFNEPPYNRARTAQPDQSAPTAPAPEAAPADSAPTESAATNETIVAVAASNDSFKTLTAALEAAGLTETLSGEGPFTVFAPTDAAFAALPAGTVEELLKPENKDQLIKVLTYHVVPGEATSSSLSSGEVKTVEGSPISVEVSDQGVMVNKAKVVQPDVQASNGVIHVIDQVILPPGM
jgi:uncharacterized surface protein with fasciclin (FAS1) repeats